LNRKKEWVLMDFEYFIGQLVLPVSFLHQLPGRGIRPVKVQLRHSYFVCCAEGKQLPACATRLNSIVAVSAHKLDIETLKCKYRYDERFELTDELHEQASRFMPCV
jgi:hypothetical protein